MCLNISRNFLKIPLKSPSMNVSLLRTYALKRIDCFVSHDNRIMRVLRVKIGLHPRRLGLIRAKPGSCAAAD